VAIRSVVEIDVHSEQFKAFSERFEKYQELLAKSTGSWSKTDKSVKAVADHLTAAILTQTDMLAKVIKGENAVEQSSKKTASSWRDFAKSSKTVAGNIKDATLSLLKWASIGGIISGLAGVGGLFGIDALARGVGDTRRQSLGLGTTYGEKKAFDINYGRVVDSDSYLSNVNEALHDPNKRSTLLSLGLNEKDLQGDTAEVAVKALEKIKALADRTDPRLYKSTMEAFGVDKLVGLQDFERLANLSKPEFASYRSPYERDKKTLNLDQRNTRAWQDFANQLKRAGEQIENIFVRRLTALVGPLDKFSQAVVKSIDTFVNSKEFDKWIKAFADDIKWAATTLGSQKFQDDIKAFATNISLAAKGIVDALKFLGIIPKSKEETLKGAQAGPPNAHIPGQPVYTEKDIAQIKAANGGDYKNARAIIDAAEKRHHLPSGFLWNQFGAESGYGKHLKSPAGAQGPMQLMPATSKRFNVKNPYSLDESAEAAAKYDELLLKRFKGSLAKTAAAYNWGEGNVDKDVTRHGDNWALPKHLPNETKDYIDKIVSGKGLSQGVKIQTDQSQTVIAEDSEARAQRDRAMGAAEASSKSLKRISEHLTREIGSWRIPFRAPAKEEKPSHADIKALAQAYSDGAGKNRATRAPQDKSVSPTRPMPKTQPDTARAVRIDINNNTGGNAVIIASQLPQ